MLDRFLIVLTQIDHARICFEEVAAASSIEEAASWAEDRFVDSPLSVVAGDREVGVLSA